MIIRTMKNFSRIYISAVLLPLLFFSCSSSEETGRITEAGNVRVVQKTIAEVEEEFVPDGRVALFKIEAQEQNKNILLRGESNLPQAVDKLRENLKGRGISFTDSILLLPSPDVENTSNGIIKTSVANLRGKAAHSSELVTQATLGTPVKVLKQDENWYFIQTPDDYLAWVDSGGIELMTNDEFVNWKSSDKLIFLETFGFSFKEPSTLSPRVADLVAGSVLELTGEQNRFYEVTYPDGRKAFVQKQFARPYDEWLASVDVSGENLVETSRTLMGLPYLWGGTSSKGVDCSGYTKTVFFLNGMIIPRDASQQITTGTVVDSTKNFNNLIPGDLLFFGRPATDTTSEKVVHVGMWIGDNRFIHSMGDVHISNMDTRAADFDEYNYNRYLRTKRVAGTKDEKLIYLKENDIFNSSGTLD